MIVYQATKARFLGDTDNRDIEDVIATRYLASTGRYAPPSYQAWSYAALLAGFNEAVHEGGAGNAPFPHYSSEILQFFSLAGQDRWSAKIAPRVAWRG